MFLIPALALMMVLVENAHDISVERQLIGTGLGIVGPGDTIHLCGVIITQLLLEMEAPKSHYHKV
jgi:hypothetical protein